MEKKKKNPKFLSTTDRTHASINVKLHKAVCIELKSSISQLGRIALREGGKTIAVGIVEGLLDQ